MNAAKSNRDRDAVFLARTEPTLSQRGDGRVRESVAESAHHLDLAHAAVVTDHEVENDGSLDGGQPGLLGVSTGATTLRQGHGGHFVGGHRGGEVIGSALSRRAGGRGTPSRCPPAARVRGQPGRWTPGSRRTPASWPRSADDPAVQRSRAAHRARGAARVAAGGARGGPTWVPRQAPRPVRAVAEGWVAARSPGSRPRASAVLLNVGPGGAGRSAKARCPARESRAHTSNRPVPDHGAPGGVSAGGVDLDRERGDAQRLDVSSTQTTRPCETALSPAMIACVFGILADRDANRLSQPGGRRRRAVEEERAVAGERHGEGGRIDRRALRWRAAARPRSPASRSGAPSA